MAPQGKKRSRASTGRVRAARPHYPCTFDLGYVRQDVYSCTKCTVSEDAPAGFCGGCKAACHGDHADAVIELYSKRAFRCDCGNGRMANSCALDSNKAASNPDNELVYSHNFAGRYCRCDRGFDPKLGDMSQCAMCEDWFHSSCLVVGGMPKKAANRALQSKLYEFTCRECVTKLPSLRNYYMTTLGVFPLPKGGTVTPIDPPADRPKDCTFPSVVVENMPDMVDYFWTPGFREKLCGCFLCKTTYMASSVSFLADVQDLVAGSSAQRESDGVLLDSTADAQIVHDVLAESPRAAQRRKMADSKNESPSADDDGKPSAGTVISAEPGSLTAATAVAAASFGSGGAQKPVPETDPEPTGTPEEQQQRQIQARIRDFLSRSIESNGRNMNHNSILSYLADLKADLLSSFNRNRGSGGAGSS
jgi:Putative zinc finger in N-recognin (UBR box)